MTTTSAATILERIIRCLSYLSIGTIAWWIVLVPVGTHPAVSLSLGLVLTIIWTAFLATSIPAAGFTLLGRFQTEYALLPWFGGAVVVAALGTWVRVFTTSSGFFPLALLITYVAFELTLRFINLQRLVSLARREGGRGKRWTRHGSK